jgi:hypothetical protein
MGPLEITANAEKVVESIRNYSRSQRELWQRVPWLALEADGRNGYCDTYARAYSTGCWALEGSVSRGYYSVYVNLFTGELVSAYSVPDDFSVISEVPKVSNLRPADNREVLKFALSLDELDAKKLISELEEEAKEPILPPYNPIGQEVWRNEIRRDLNLKKIYVRNSR